MPPSLTQLGIDARDFEKMAKQAVQNGWLSYAWIPLNEQDVISIYRDSL